MGVGLLLWGHVPPCSLLCAAGGLPCLWGLGGARPALQAQLSRKPGPQHHLRPWSGAPLHLPSPGVGFTGPRALLPSHLEDFEAQNPFWGRGAGPGRGRSLSLELHLGLGVVQVWTQLTRGRGARHVWSDMGGARFSLPSPICLLPDSPDTEMPAMSTSWSPARRDQ